jgi:energy-coupling factor transport system permease protein
MFIYLDKDSFLHHLHPVTKIVGLLLLFLWAMVFSHPLYLGVIFFIVFLFSIIAKSLSNLKKFWILLIVFAFFSTLLWSFFLRGRTTLFRLGFIQISRESLLYGLAMGIRIDTIIISGIIFLSSTRTEDFTQGLNSLGLPFPVSFALSLSFRLVPTFAGTTSTIIQAQKSRGLDLESGGLWKKIKKHIPLFIPILIHAIRNTDLLAMALESKGFGFRKKRTYYLHFKFSWRDWLTIAILAGLIGFSFYIRSTGRAQFSTGYTYFFFSSKTAWAAASRATGTL